MKPSNSFIGDMLDPITEGENSTVWCAGFPTEVKEHNGDILLTVPFNPVKNYEFKTFAGNSRSYEVRLRACGSQILRVSVVFQGELLPDDNEMLSWHSSTKQEPLNFRKTETGYNIIDNRNNIRAAINNTNPDVHPWRTPDEVGSNDTPEMLNIAFYPDSHVKVNLASADRFGPEHPESLPLAFVEKDGTPLYSLYSFEALLDEKFAGTGERFRKMDLSGGTYLLENRDALGVNNQRAYKNVPFYVSSRLYGLFTHTSRHMRISLADISTRAAQARIEEPVVDLFIIGGGSVEKVLYNYKCITGFPATLPLWSYGIWMSRMTYFTDKEVRGIGQKLRDGKFPCDVLHIDTGWFAKNWVCEWEFGTTNFPDPARFMADMLKQGFRITLWQMPNISRGNKLLEEARQKRYLAPIKGAEISGSDFSALGAAGQIDFSNPEAVKWYQLLLANLLKMGVSAIKTDFGEELNMTGDYLNMPAEQLHNLYGLLYQKAAWEVTKEVTGDGIAWSRAGWAGCQRYPLHWGGDCTCSWEGLAGSLRGGLHLGLSGFGLWSHDVPGFLGTPNFMWSRPSNNLYVRWTQFGVFTSHLRYHGAQPREPYEYPEIADIVRSWWNMRYALIPYIIDMGEKSTTTGLPVLRALIFNHGDDPTCWHIDDQYYFGDAFMVAPVYNDEGVRDVYLPEGEWVDFWTGEGLKGCQWLRGVTVPLERMPLYVKAGSKIRLYPEVVQSTADMDMDKCRELVFDDNYQGFSKSILGDVSGLAVAK